MIEDKTFHKTLSTFSHSQNRVLASAIVNERMFRVKPYTKCLQCIQDNDRMRCQKCMQTIINLISESNNTNSVKVKPPKKIFRIRSNEIKNLNKKSQIKSHGNQNFQIRRIKTQKGDQKIFSQTIHKQSFGTHKNSCESKRAMTTNKNERLMVTSKYKNWMEQRQKRKHLDITTSCWPRKTRNHDVNLQKYGAKEPRFERWQKKLLDQLISKTKQIR